MNRFAENRKARFSYDFLETFEAGIELQGLEVKSVRQGKVSLDGAYVIVRGGEAFLVKATIQPYQQNNTPQEYEPEHARKLLLSKKEIAQLENAQDSQGLTIVPISMYNNKNRVKVEIALARGKKSFDKRESIKKRETYRETRRTLKYQ